MCFPAATYADLRSAPDSQSFYYVHEAIPCEVAETSCLSPRIGHVIRQRSARYSSPAKEKTSACASFLGKSGLGFSYTASWTGRTPTFTSGHSQAEQLRNALIKNAGYRFVPLLHE